MKPVSGLKSKSSVSRIQIDTSNPSNGILKTDEVLTGWQLKSEMIDDH